MADANRESQGHPPARILMFSQRNIWERVHYRCPPYEFEDLIRKMDSVDMVAPTPKRQYRHMTGIAQNLAINYGISFNPGIPKIRARDRYDVFFAICQYPKDMLHLQDVEEWKKRCRTSICWLDESWISEFHKYRYYFKLLSSFDHVLVTMSQCIDPLSQRIGPKCSHMPAGIDTILFCPYPGFPHRGIDVLNVGRRAERTHEALLRMVRENRIFYVYDSLMGHRVFDPNQHRLLYANTAKRSKYCVANPGKIDEPETLRGQCEIGYRYLEGLAAGAILIGEYPKNEEFHRIFGWEDVVIPLSWNSDEIETVLEEWNRQPERQAQARKRNVLKSLQHHDWAYRWEKVLEIAGLEPLDGLRERKGRLAAIADSVERDMNDCPV